MNEVEEKDYKLYCDCETDDERKNYLRSARAQLTGIICMSLAKDIVAWIERLEADNAAMKVERQEFEQYIASRNLSEYIAALKATRDQLKTQHEADEKALRILAEMHGCPTMEYANKCDINRENILTCTDCKIAYAKQEAAKK
jgi:hypothetical protein